MGKPLKAKQLNLDKSQRERVLKFQGVKVNKRIRLGHTGHFGKVDVIPLAGKPSKLKVAAKEDKYDPVSDQDKSSAVKQHDGRLPGESYSKFIKRLNKETREALVELSSKTHKINSKRKAYLEGRKASASQKKMQAKKTQILEKMKMELDSSGPTYSRSKHADPMSLEDAKSTLVATTDANYVRFGEQAERPPQIKISKPFKGLNKLVPENRAYVVGGVPAIPEVSGSEKSRREMEMLRQKAVKSYRDMIKKRREGQGFMSL